MKYDVCVTYRTGWLRMEFFMRWNCLALWSAAKLTGYKVHHTPFPWPLGLRNIVT